MTTISTNPMTAEPRRKINNGKEEHVRRNLSRRYIHGCAPALLTNIHILRVKGERKTFGLVGQPLKLFHTCCYAFCLQRFLVKGHRSIFIVTRRPRYPKPNHPPHLNIMLGKQTYIFNCFLQEHRVTLLTSAIAKRAI